MMGNERAMGMSDAGLYHAMQRVNMKRDHGAASETFWMVEHKTPADDGRPRWARWFKDGIKPKIEWTTDWEKATHYETSESAWSSASVAKGRFDESCIATEHTRLRPPVAVSEKNDLDRFMEKVAKQPNLSGCWSWTGGQTGGGYGKFQFRGRGWRAHRAAWEMFVGPIPGGGMCVLHRCDNRLCVNPSHLFLGTMRDNNHDMIRKGRQNKASNATKKLKETDIPVIRAERVSGVSITALAKRYDVVRATIRNVIDGISWRHVA